MDEPEIELDVVDFGPSGDQAPPRRRWTRLIIASAVAAAVVGALVAQNMNHAAPAAAPTPTHGSTYIGPSTPVPLPSVTVPSVIDVGHPLLGITGGWELFARTYTGILRIEMSRGRVTTTPVPPLNSSGPVWFTVGPAWAMIRPLDVVPGYLVPDGQPAHRLGGALDSSPYAFPGPDPEHVWTTPALDGPPPVAALVDANGRPAGPSIPIPNGLDGDIRGDADGYLVVGGPGGVYDLRPDAIQRVTTGALLALGPTRWLTLECDERFHCDTVVIDRGTGARRTLPVSGLSPAGATGIVAPGVISPDGRYAGLLETDRAGVSAHLIDLVAGTDRRLDVAVNLEFADESMVFSPDSHWLFLLGGTGTLVPVDAATGQLYDLGASLPPVTQLAIRDATG